MGRAVLALILCGLVLPGCASTPLERGDDLLARGEYEAAASEYRQALATEPGDERAVRRLEEAQQRGALAHYQNALGRNAAGDLDGAVRELELAVRLNPELAQARDYLERARAKRGEVLALIDAGRAKLDGGDPVAAAATLAQALPYGAGIPGFDALHDKARRGAAAALREQAARKLAAGEIESASADLAEAARLERAGTGAGRPAAPGVVRPSAAGGAAGGTAGSQAAIAGPPPGTATLDDYAAAAAEVKRLTDDLPRRPPGGGIARPEDYAMSEDDIAALGAAVARALAAKPPGETLPTWLAHGRITLRMAREVAVLRRLATARSLAEAADPAGAWREVEAARRVDPDMLNIPEAAASLEAVRTATAHRLIALARRDIAGGYLNLGRLRARQAKELAPAEEAAAADALAWAEGAGAGQAIVVMPFQNYTQTEGLSERLYARLMERLKAAGAGPIFTFEAYRRQRETGRLAPLAGLAKGDLIRLDFRDARDVEAAAAARVAAYRRALDEARRRFAAAESAPDRARARAAVEDAERNLARAERERAASVFAASGGHRPAGMPARSEGGGGQAQGLAGDTPVSATLELHFQLHDPNVGRDIIAEPVVRTARGIASERTAVEDRLIDDALEPVVNAITARFYDVARANRQQAELDPRRALDEKIGALDRQVAASAGDGSGAGGAPDAAAAAVVLEATGYSYVERRTIPARLTFD